MNRITEISKKKKKFSCLSDEKHLLKEFAAVVIEKHSFWHKYEDCHYL